MFVAEEAKAKRDELNLSPQNLSKITSKYIAEVFKSSYKTFLKLQVITILGYEVLFGGKGIIDCGRVLLGKEIDSIVKK